jgi:hypothetical protein
MREADDAPKDGWVVEYYVVLGADPGMNNTVEQLQISQSQLK